MPRLTLIPQDALHLWRQVHVAQVRADSPDLTARQMAVLLTVYLTPRPHTVRGLAASLGVGKPVITRALDTLGALGLLKRERDPDDKRSVLVERTSAGSVYLSELSAMIVQKGQEL